MLKIFIFKKSLKKKFKMESKYIVWSTLTAAVLSEELLRLEKGVLPKIKTAL